MKVYNVGKIRPKGHAARNCVKARYIRASKKENREWLIPDEDFYRLTSSNCHYCGTEPQQILKARRMNGDYIYNGLDRINNDKGYTLENVVTCCIICNRAKRCMKQEDFIAWLERIKTHRS